MEPMSQTEYRTQAVRIKHGLTEHSPLIAWTLRTDIALAEVGERLPFLIRGQVQIGQRHITVSVKVSQILVATAKFDVVEYIRREFGKRLADALMNWVVEKT